MIKYYKQSNTVNAVNAANEKCEFCLEFCNFSILVMVK